MTSPLVIFDLDGTLADTAPDLVATLNRITKPYNLNPVSPGGLGFIIGNGARAMIARAFELNNLDLEDRLLDELFHSFLKDYEKNLANRTTVYDGLDRTLDQLTASGHTLAVCTNKTERLARLLLEELGLTNRFAAITGGDTFEFRKPDARHLRETAHLAGCTLEKAIMVGDSKNDISAAINAKIPSVAVTFGYSDIPVETLGADRVIDHLDQLVNAIAGITTR